MNLVENHKLRVQARQEGQDDRCEAPSAALSALAEVAQMIAATDPSTGTIGDNERSTLLLAIKTAYEKVDAERSALLLALQAAYSAVSALRTVPKKEETQEEKGE